MVMRQLTVVQILGIYLASPTEYIYLLWLKLST